MKHLLLYICLCLVFLGSLFTTGDVFAQPIPTPPIPPTTIPPPAVAAPAGPTRADQLAAEAPRVGANPSPARGWAAWAYGSIENGLGNAIKWVAIGILGFFAWTVSIAGLLLNYAISYLVIGMGSLIRDGGFGAPIDELWRFIRDLVNISFVFALVYIGITTIINSGASGAKKLLGAVVISALLVNFSLFFAKAIIDVSNLVATTVYSKMVADPRAASDAAYGISAAFTNKMGITALMTGGRADASTQALMRSAMGVSAGTTTADNLSAPVSGGGLAFTLIYALGSSVILFQLAFAFGIGAFILIIRFIMLIVLMILSPLAFLPDVLPGLGGYAKQWWSTLISQAFVAPVYLFGLYLAFFVIDKAPFPQDASGLMGLFLESGSAPTVRILLFYCIAIALIIGATTMAKKMSASAGSFAVKATEYAGGKLKKAILLPTKAITKPAAWAARKTVGGLSSAAGKWNDRLQSTKGGRFAKGALSALSLGALNERGRRDLIKKGKTAKIGSSSYQDDNDLKEAVKKTEVMQERTKKREAALAVYKATPTNSNRVLAAAEVQKMSNAELDEQSSTDLQAISGLLSNKQADYVKDHATKWNDQEKTALKDSRKKDQLERFGVIDPRTGLSDGSKAADFFDGMKSEEFSKLPKEIILHLASVPYFTGEVLRKIHAADALIPAEARSLAASIRALHLPTTHSSVIYLDSNAGRSSY